MVAKTYQTLKKASEPYEKNKKMYIDMETKKGAIKSVRWYTVEEYNKMYPEAQIKVSIDLKHALGFDKGYITIFKGKDEDWFSNSNCRFHRFWGWYIVSTEEIPDDKPKNIIPYHLDWEDVKETDDKLKDEALIKKKIMKLFAV